MMGGDIPVKAALGVGTTFRVALPALGVDALPAAAAAARNVQGTI
jgi:hypothetical protein